ncbi:hypothetical protein DPMN_182520 [Dreissena polymorpha]|uniref:Uncharacterized protein n=1 Tax=Dreissena polymorpha TaxID=45954 RepID=A0A9D4DFM4_DREPO|nr:hypothetical protein DPMN_182520 [Dreissena polymorpha]
MHLISEQGMADTTLVQVFTQKREFELNCGKIAYEQVYKGHSGVNVDFIAIDKCFRNETVTMSDDLKRAIKQVKR